ncbi:F510_1955 family glycosylhydrolase [Paenisporosarcina sp. NPDC076898]|uniref:F510_1955 family glycosylhydrolase n=1 Tax=unclassified Paenisporosarcina TaxID=2642018 RepID=UPI003D053427
MYKKIGLIIVGLTLFLSACNSKDQETYTFEEVKDEKIDHMHGLGYTNGKDTVVIATHGGLYEYDGKWKAATSRKHDYMGFSAVNEGFYSSGHPEPNSDLKNPLGIIKSEDKGASFKQLAFYGEADFHYMTAGYKTNTIYLINETSNENLDFGLHYSKDEGQSWTMSKMEGFKSKYISNLAAHPTLSSQLVIGSQEGLYLSTDYGNTFTRLGSPTVITYVTLTEKAGIYASIEKEKVKLMNLNLDNNDLEEMNVPDFSQNNPIVQIALNPTNEQEITIATYENDIYQTKNQGVTWKMIAEKGTLQE